MARLQLHFNGNFSLKKEEISKIIKAASEEKGLDDSLENLITRTTLGNGKVGRIKSWAIRAGLIANNRLTPEGKIVLQRDNYLESNITSWLMHFYLSFGDKGLQKLPDNPADWGGWCYFIYSFLPEHRVFTHDELLHQATLVFDEESKVIATRLKYILRAYTESSALGLCKFITQDKEKYYTNNDQLPNAYLLGYFLAKLWERDFSDQGSVATELIIKQKMGLSAVLGIQLKALQEQLNTLEAYGIIEQRRTVPPFQIIPRWHNPLTLLEKAYE